MRLGGDGAAMALGVACAAAGVGGAMAACVAITRVAAQPVLLDYPFLVFIMVVILGLVGLFSLACGFICAREVVRTFFW